MSINLTDEIEVKTKKGKLGAAKQIFLEGDMQTVENEIQNINSRHNTLNTKHESLSRTVQGIAATGGANTATNVTYNNSTSGLNAENAQDAIDEVSSIIDTLGSNISELKKEVRKTLKLNKGYWIRYNISSQTYVFERYSLSIITEVLLLPIKPVTFYNYWRGITETYLGYSLLYLNSSFEFIGGKMFDEGTSYIFNPIDESIPDGAVYIVVQSQEKNNKVYYVSEENLGTGIDIRKTILDKNQFSDLNKNISDTNKNISDTNKRIDNLDNFVVKELVNFVAKDKSINLFNKNDSRIQVNKFINSISGGKAEIIDLNDCRVTHPIFVEANTTIKVPYNINFSNKNNLMYIDTAQAVTSTLEKDGDTIIAFLYQIPRNGYVLFNYWFSQEDNLMICIKDEFPNKYVPFFSKIEEGVDLSNQQKEDISLLLRDKADLIKEQGKNLFDKSQVIYGYYLSSNTGKLASNANSAISPKIEITPGSIYHISRPNLKETGVVCFIDENENRLKPLKIDGTEWSSYEPSTGDSGGNRKECKCKAPDTAKYIQFTVIFANTGSIDNTQIELGQDFTGYEEYNCKNVLPYVELPKELIEQLNNIGTVENIINIENSDKIGVFGTSFMNGYAMKNHHHLNHLSMFLDYIIYNYGHSGDDELENLDKLERDLTWLGVIPPSKWNIKYGIVMHEENSGALKSASSDTIYENSKKLANAIKSLGGIPIFSTEHDADYAYYQGAIQLCNEEGYMFMRWGTLARKLFNKVFAPFWYNSHPATRTGWMVTNGMLPYLQSLPRPTQCIKLFRVRESIDTTNLQNLVFEDLYTRAQRYVELTCGVSALTQATEKYFDRLDATGKVFEDVNDEYQYLQNKQAVSFGNFAMINLILPYTKVGLKKLILYFSGTGVTNVYIQKIRQISNPLPATRYVAFGITQGASLIQPGDTFAVTGGVYNDNIKGNYTVSGIINGMLVTTTNSSRKTTSGTDTPIITSSDFDVSNVTLSGSYDYPSYDYMSRYKQPLGEWIDVTSEQLEDGGFKLTNYIDTCLNFDSVAILLKGTNISISDIFAKVVGSELKTIHNIPMFKYQKGESLITDSLLDNNTSWEGISDITNYDNTQIISTVSSSYESLPIGITTVKEFQQGQSIRQSILSSVLNNNNEYGEPIKIQIRVIARYFPNYVDSDAKWATSEITEQSFDVARFAIYFGNTSNQTNPTKVAEFNVGAWWNEFITETYCEDSQLNYIKAVCTDKKVQVAKIEVVKIS